MIFFALLAFLSQVFASEDTYSDEEELALTSLFHSSDKASRDYAHSTASRYDSPRVQTKVYQKSRLASLNDLFGKVVIIFRADKLPSVKDTVLEGNIFLPLTGINTSVGDIYYVSWYMEYLVTGEGTEVVYIPHFCDSSISDIDFVVKCQNYSRFNKCQTSKINCKYPARGDLSELNGQTNLKFDASGRRILRPGEVHGSLDWPRRLTVMASFLEAIQTVGLHFPNKLNNISRVWPLAHKKPDEAMEIVSYASGLRQFDLLDTSKPVAYLRRVADLREGITPPIFPLYWRHPNCYLLAARPVGVIPQKNISMFWVLKVEFYRSFRVNRPTSAWLYEHYDELTPVAIYHMLEKQYNSNPR